MGFDSVTHPTVAIRALTCKRGRSHDSRLCVWQGIVMIVSVENNLQASHALLEVMGLPFTLGIHNLVVGVKR
jgi:hypothetical protein